MSDHAKSDRETVFLEELQASPVIAAIKDDEGLEEVLKSECRAVFILRGSILNIAETVRRIKDSGRMTLVHADLIDGLSTKDVCVDYIASQTAADGILSTRVNIIRRARELGLVAIQRFFLLDSISIHNLEKQPLHTTAIDIMPGVMPGVIRNLAGRVSSPIIASGLLSAKEDIIAALSAGALAVSTTNSELWSV